MDTTSMEIRLNARLERMERLLGEKIATVERKHAAEIAKLKHPSNPSPVLLEDQTPKDNNQQSYYWDDEDHTKDKCRCGLMYVRAFVNGYSVLAMIDSGATHSFITTRIIRYLGAKTSPGGNKFKTFTEQVILDEGNVSLNLTVGGWQGDQAFIVSEVSASDVLLGMDFLIAVEVIVIPKYWGIYVGGGHQRFVEAYSTHDKEEVMNGWIFDEGRQMCPRPNKIPRWTLD